MNKYESVILIDPNVDEAGVKELIQKFSDLINSDGNVVKVTDMGKRKTAYPVKKNKEAIYYEILFEANPQLIQELERNYRITDEVIKFLVIRREGELVSTLEPKQEETSKNDVKESDTNVKSDDVKETETKKDSKAKKAEAKKAETKEAEAEAKVEETVDSENEE